MKQEEFEELTESFATVCYEVGWQHAKATPSDIAEASRAEIWEKVLDAFKASERLSEIRRKRIGVEQGRLEQAFEDARVDRAKLAELEKTVEEFVCPECCTIINVVPKDG